MLGSDIEVISIRGIYQPANTMAHLTQKIFKMFRAQKYIIFCTLFAFNSILLAWFETYFAT